MKESFADRHRGYWPLLGVYRLGEDGYKVTESVQQIFGEPPAKRPRGTARDDGERWDASIARARSSVRDLALCNPWSHFVTLTISADKHDRHDLTAYHKRLRQFLVNQNRGRASKITYLLVPERHRDGAWHVHGLMHGLEAADLYRNQYGYWGWRAYEKSFGFLSLGHIRDRRAVIGYVCKYIAKSLSADIKKANAHLFYRSRGLREPELIAKGPGRFDGEWQHVNAEHGTKVAYVPALDAVDIVSDMMPLTRDQLPADEECKLNLISGVAAEVMDGYAPLSMAGW